MQMQFDPGGIRTVGHAIEAIARTLTSTRHADGLGGNEGFETTVAMQEVDAAIIEEMRGVGEVIQGDGEAVHAMATSYRNIEDEAAGASDHYFGGV